MSSKSVEDYFSMVRPTRDGNLSPYLPTTPLQKTLSWGNTPDFPKLSKPKTNSTHYDANLKSFKLPSDNTVHVYHTIHVNEPVPEYLRPLSPEEVLKKSTGKCLNCLTQKNAACNHLEAEKIFSGTNHKHLPKKAIKSIIANKGNKETAIDSHFNNSVSFDTVNLKYDDDINNYPASAFSDSGSEDDQNSKDFTNERGRDKYDAQFLHHSRSPSRSVSPTLRRSPMKFDMMSSTASLKEETKAFSRMFSMAYPTSPIIRHDACALTRKHRFFDDMYANRMKSVKPKLDNRVVMCYISGRRHTWVGIDWACNRLLEDGDTLIIVSAIRNPSRSLNIHNSRGSASVKYDITENSIRNSSEYAQAVCDNIMKYVLTVLSPDRVVKVTVELAIGSTTDVFEEMFELYQPSLVITGCKPPYAAPTKSWSTKRLTDRIVQILPVPTIIVSPGNMELFEKKLFKAVDKRLRYLNRNHPNTDLENDEILKQLRNVGTYDLEDQEEFIIKTGENHPKILKDLKMVAQDRKSLLAKHLMDVDLSGEDSESISSESSYNADEENDSASDVDSDDDSISVDSANPPAFVASINKTASYKMKTLQLEAEISVYKAFTKLEREPLNEDSFKNLLTVVSDSAHRYGIALAESAKQGGEESKLVRTLTGAPEQLERRKSMVSEVLDKDQDAFEEKFKRLRERKLKEEADAKLAAKQKKGKGFIPKININLKSTKSPPSAASSISTSTNSIMGSATNNSFSNSDSSKTKPKKKRSLFGFFGKK